jgi:hypothetical protein
VTVRVDCACGGVFEAPEGMAGGFANCPRCGRAAAVPGLRDPAWRVLQGVGMVFVVLPTAIAATGFGLGVGLLVGAGLATLFWVLSRAL